MAEVLKNLGSQHVLVVHSADGLDEISIADETYVAELRDGEISEYTITPEQFGMTRASLDSLKVSGAAESLVIVNALLVGEKSAAADIVALNAGAALYAANVADSLAQGIKTAQEVLNSGKGLEKLHELVALTRAMKEG